MALLYYGPALLWPYFTMALLYYGPALLWQVRKAFRTLDEDASGKLSYDELKQVLMMFNLSIPAKVRGTRVVVAVVAVLAVVVVLGGR